ncbi:hypothetical protein CHUAL_003791 [Chamberlinius hualienensis]
MTPYQWIFSTALLSMFIATSNLSPFNSTDFSSETSDNETFVFEDDESSGRIFILVNGTLGARPNFAVSITLIGFSIFLLWGSAVQNYPLTAGRSFNSDSLLTKYKRVDHHYLNDTI